MMTMKLPLEDEQHRNLADNWLLESYEVVDRIDVPVSPTWEVSALILFEMQGAALRAASKEQVAQMVRDMSNGDKFPPIAVTAGHEGRWKVEDGNHRIIAAHESGLESLPALVLMLRSGYEEGGDD